jgi:hypothetical protein
MLCMSLDDHVHSAQNTRQICAKFRIVEDMEIILNLPKIMPNPFWALSIHSGHPITCCPDRKRVEKAENWR